jgi:hypothetical protein
MFHFKELFFAEVTNSDHYIRYVGFCVHCYFDFNIPHKIQGDM